MIFEKQSPIRFNLHKKTAKISSQAAPNLDIPIVSIGGVTYLYKAGLLEATRRGYGRIMQRGVDFLKRKSGDILASDLEEFEEYRAFKANDKQRPEGKDISKTIPNLSPEEHLDALYIDLNSTLKDDLLS